MSALSHPSANTARPPQWAEGVAGPAWRARDRTGGLTTEPRDQTARGPAPSSQAQHRMALSSSGGGHGRMTGRAHLQTEPRLWPSAHSPGRTPGLPRFFPPSQQRLAMALNPYGRGQGLQNADLGPLGELLPVCLTVKNKACLCGLEPLLGSLVLSSDCALCVGWGCVV